MLNGPLKDERGNQQSDSSSKWIPPAPKCGGGQI